jgi:hypothetical protein
LFSSESTGSAVARRAAGSSRITKQTARHIRGRIALGGRKVGMTVFLKW